MLCAVNKTTFGEPSLYPVHHDDRRPIEADDWLEGRKVFHVSPFLPVDGSYRFRFRLDERLVHVDVNYHDAEGLMLATSVGGRLEPLSNRGVARRFLGKPLMTLAVIARIHWCPETLAKAGEILQQACTAARIHHPLACMCTPPPPSSSRPSSGWPSAG